jgi:hypothetical protein
MLLEKLNAEKTRINDLLIIYHGKKTSAFPNETIHIVPKCIVHLHGHQNKVVPLVKPSILVDFNNGIKFHNYTC